jgi:hypothetical protein
VRLGVHLRAVLCGSTSSDCCDSALERRSDHDEALGELTDTEEWRQNAANSKSMAATEQPPAPVTVLNRVLPVAVRDTRLLREKGKRTWGVYRGVKCVHINDEGSPWRNVRGLKVDDYKRYIYERPELLAKLPELTDKLIVCTHKHAKGKRCLAEGLCELVRDGYAALTLTTLAPVLWAHLPHDVLWHVLMPMCSPACYYRLCRVSKRFRKFVLEKGDVEAWVRRSVAIHLRKMEETRKRLQQPPTGLDANYSTSGFVVYHMARAKEPRVLDVAAELLYELPGDHWSHGDRDLAFELLRRTVAKHGARQVLIRTLSYKGNRYPQAVQYQYWLNNHSLLCEPRCYELFAESGHAVKLRHDPEERRWRYRVKRGEAWKIVSPFLALTAEEAAELPK